MPAAKQLNIYPCKYKEPMENTESIGQSHFERKWHRQNLNVEGRFDLRLDVKYPHLGTINELYEMVHIEK